MPAQDKPEPITPLQQAAKPLRRAAPEPLLPVVLREVRGFCAAHVDRRGSIATARSGPTSSARSPRRGGSG